MGDRDSDSDGDDDEEKVTVRVIDAVKSDVRDDVAHSLPQTHAVAVGSHM